MLYRQRGLLKKDAPLRIGQNDTAPLGALDDLNIVKSRVETAQTEFEAVLAMLAAVTGALVAAGLGKNWNHLTHKTDRNV